ncbi:acyl-CoA dehydrogenase family protein [Pendulispora brunnea]|uniref:Acyl-CoA dehydrogenase family protein n=1 Tax=Pendulispora brunnea TaxID=2905690 RepID=A0ABZ2JY61_9BACT
MDLNFTAEEQAFREEVRQFVRANLPARISEKVLHGKPLGKEDLEGWQRILHKKGWAGFTWPREFGGTGWSAVQRHIFEEECSAAGAPPIVAFGLLMVAPVIMAFGSPAQQERFLPRILASEDWWCQGYSEPGSGSDLASLQTRAERQGDHYVVNGVKTWNTLGQYADWIFCLVRTKPDARPQAGISFLLIDMKSPGITVRPIRMLDGRDDEVNEVWLENVQVPVENLIGEENKGWTYAKYLLSHERTNIAEVGRSKRQLLRLKQIAAEQRAGAQPLLADPRFRDKIAQIEIDLMALEITCLRVLAAEAQKKGAAPEASLLKIRGTEIRQAISELTLLAAGHHASPYLPEALEDGYSPDPLLPEAHASLAGTYFNDRKVSIYGGSNEIQRNIIAQMILGL